LHAASINGCHQRGSSKRLTPVTLQIAAKLSRCMTVSRVIHPCSPAGPFPYVDPADISHAVVYLSSDESRYVTGQQLFVDAGAGLKMGL
jgi:NAD(P)-dependent dehydrogenase (short-subunit alcohol dehydrogenase family)